MDDSSGNISTLSLMTSLGLIIAIIFYLRFRLKYKKDINGNQFEWKIEVLSKENNKTQTKLGEGLQDLLTYQMLDITFLQMKNSQINIMKALPTWNLMNLNALYLNSNNIESIEQLGWTRFPNLQALDISNNLIIQLKSLRKMQMQNLILMSLNNNPICNRIDLSQFNLINLQYLWLEFFQGQRRFHDDIRTFAKFQCVLLLKFHIKSSQRIYDKSFMDVLQRKYHNIDIRKKDL